MATTPLRLRILEALTSALEEITVANGYATTLTGAVFRGRNVFGDTDPLPMVSILEAPDPVNPFASPPDSGDQKGAWVLIIQGWVEDDLANPTDPAYVLLADVCKRLSLEKLKNRDFAMFGADLGKKITNMTLGTRVVRPPDDASTKAYFVLSISLDVVESLTDPYED